jgi:hypothetical protein
MYKIHKDLTTPDRKTIIWRYMSLSKFLSLINNEQLYFARHDKFFDAQEGVLSDLDKSFFDSKVPGISSRMKCENLGCTFMNCWIISDLELYLMWTAYSSIDEGIAIKTTVGSLIDSLDSNDERCIFISDVNYIDHNTQYTFDKTGGFANLLAPFFCKGQYFQQEKELRMIYCNYEIDERDEIEGVQFKVSLDVLIDEVWIAPRAKTWYEDIIKKELLLHNIKKPLKRSCIRARS